ncbi:MAG: sugar phosphate isomerase/epimerase, partial [Saprospiraceae bacterium]|nr:sugar phosphate isomerase/epimerase [Saprospiraceae bacterium]
EFIRMFHVKDAEYNPTGKCGVYGGYQDWKDRPGRFRSLGDGQVDFVGVFSRLTQHGYRGWAVLEWECCIISAEQGAAEGAPFLDAHIIQASTKRFDDFAGTGHDDALNRSILGLD